MTSSPPPPPRQPVPPTPVAEDLAAYHEATEPGPSPGVRALLGFGLGAAVGALALALLPRRHEGE